MTSHFPSPFKMSRFCGISHESDTWAFHVKLPPRASPKGRAFCHSRKRLRTVADGCEHKRNFWRTHLHPDPHYKREPLLRIREKDMSSKVEEPAIRFSGKAWGSKFKSTLLRRALGGQSSSLCGICRDPLKKRCPGAHVSECGPKLTSDTSGTSNKRNNISAAGAARVLACVRAQLARKYSVCLAPARVRSNCKVQGDGSRTKTKLKLGKQTRGRKRGCWLPRSGTTMLTICLAKHTCWVPQKLQDCANILIDQCPPHPRLGIQVPP